MVTADAKKNRLYLRIPESADEKSLKNLYNDLQSCIADLSPGFQVVADMSKCNVIFLRGLPTFKKMMDSFVLNKVGEVIEVINDSKVSYKQICRFMASIQCFRPLSANSLQEAELKLESHAKRTGIRFKLNRPMVEYRNGEAQPDTGYIADISISGCAIETASGTPPIGDEIVVMVTFEDDPNLITSFQASAKVVRSDKMMFAVQFINVDEKHQERLYERLAHELGRPI